MEMTKSEFKRRLEELHDRCRRYYPEPFPWSGIPQQLCNNAIPNRVIKIVEDQLPFCTAYEKEFWCDNIISAVLLNNIEFKREEAMEQYVYVVQDVNGEVDSVWKYDHTTISSNEVGAYVDRFAKTNNLRGFKRFEVKTSFEKECNELEETMVLEALGKLSDEEIKLLGLDKAYPHYLQ